LNKQGQSCQQPNQLTRKTGLTTDL